MGDIGSIQTVKDLSRHFLLLIDWCSVQNGPKLDQRWGDHLRVQME